MKRTGIIFMTLASLALAVGLAAPMVAKREKRNQPTPQLDSHNFFATPQADETSVPTFVSGSGRPLSSSRAVRPLQFNILRQLPSLTQPQRQEVARFERRLNKQLGALNSATSELQQKLDAQTAAGKGAAPEAAALKNDISELKKQTNDARQDAYEDVFNQLSYKQWQEYEDMKHGDLNIEPVPLMNTSESGGK